MLVLGNLHINVAGATSLTPLWSRPGPMHLKAAPHRATFAENVPWAEIRFRTLAAEFRFRATSSPGRLLQRTIENVKPD